MLAREDAKRGDEMHDRAASRYHVGMLRNTADSWGAPAKWFHWVMAVLILALAALRLLWRLANPAPALPSGVPAWERAAARSSHLLLYVLMIALPITGWIVNSASNIPFRIFWLIPLPAIVAPDKSTADLVALVHRGLAALLALVLVAHIGAALRHHFVKRNTVLMRMLPGAWRTP